HGELLALAHPPLSRAEARALCYGVLTEDQRRRFEHERELDFAVAVPGLGRFRGNLYLTRGTVGGAFRVIPADLPVLDSLARPPPAPTASAPRRWSPASPTCRAVSCWSAELRAAARAPRSPPWSTTSTASGAVTSSPSRIRSSSSTSPSAAS